MLLVRHMLAAPAQLRRFLVTGVVNTAVHTCVAVTLIAGIDSDVTVANVIAFCTATGTSYVLNTLWSFSQALSGATLVKFVIVSIVGAMITAAVARVADVLGAHYLVGIACVAVTVAPTTFTLHKYWTYGSR